MIAKPGSALLQLGVVLIAFVSALGAQNLSEVGREVAIARHMQDGEEFNASIPADASIRLTS